MKIYSSTYIALLITSFTFSCPIQAQYSLMDHQKNKDIQLIGNEKHSFEVQLKKEDFIEFQIEQKDVNLQVLVLSQQMDTLQIINTNNTKNDIEIVQFQAIDPGTYTFQISSHIPEYLSDSDLLSHIENINGAFQFNEPRIFSKGEYIKKMSIEDAQRDAVISWINTNSTPLNGVRAETGLEDFSSLKTILEDKKVIGLGETSHGTKEMFQMKHRFLEFLVKEMGFRTFAIEASHIGCRPINDYVLYGKSNSRDALSSQGFWVWDTEEVVDMIEWMRKYNAEVSDDKKVQFVGIDTQVKALELAYDNINTFLSKTKINTKIKEQVDSLFVKLSTSINYKDISSQRNKLYELLSKLVLHKTKLVHNSSISEYENVIADFRKVLQGVESNDRKLQKNTSTYSIRDEFMAQTVLEISQKQPGRKIVIWAHNGHISKNSKEKVNGYPNPLGSALARYFGDDYYAIGFSTYQGSFQAMNYLPREKKYTGVIPFQIPPALEGSLDWYFAQSKNDIFFIDLNESNSSSPAIKNFLNKKLEMYYAGASWSKDYTHASKQRIVPVKTFDGMIFIQETSSANLTPNGKKEVMRRLQNKRLQKKS
ncbi:erythromycin esterase family protein [Aquimarina spongiae]|uniref:Erythromycin esterase n=1 Tax=Aquimarina spongiae TaxID=570521 RepID=A0A1M6FIU9_9FLAO|nr:erythromycin esterase family protein [Aquimarina spongiae]SHI97604.1 erythromycin esterase [Aquimarina spongiae]